MQIISFAYIFCCCSCWSPFAFDNWKTTCPHLCTLYARVIVETRPNVSKSSRSCQVNRYEATCVRGSQGVKGVLFQSYSIDPLAILNWRHISRCKRFGFCGEHANGTFNYGTCESEARIVCVCVYNGGEIPHFPLYPSSSWRSNYRKKKKVRIQDDKVRRGWC